MLLQQIFPRALTEAIHAPFAFDVYQIIDACAAHAKTAEALRAQLTTRLSSFFRAKLADTEVHHQGLTLAVYVAEPAGNYHGGGVFRSYDMDINIADNNGLLNDGLPAVPDKTMEIWVFVEESRLNGILEKWHNYMDTMQSIGATLIHEFIHVVQHCRRKNDVNASGSINRYTIGVARAKKDGKRLGKRGEYVSPNVNAPAYYGTAIEIEAHSATAAAEIVHRARREAPDDQRAYLEKTLRSLRDNSQTLLTYREKFRKIMLFFGGAGTSNPKKSAQLKRQKAIVWNSFRMKLAKHLIHYIAALPVNKDALREIDRGGELGDDKQWDHLNKADVEPRQGQLFPDHEKDYDVQGHFDGYDVATSNNAQDDDVTYALFRGSTPVAYISLKFFLDADNYYQVKGIRIAPSEQGKGLAPRFYHWLLTDGHIDRLYADEQQTDGGAKIWERLLKQPGIGVFLARMDYDAAHDGRRVNTLRGLEKVWQSDQYALYAEAV